MLYFIYKSIKNLLYEDYNEILPGLYISGIQTAMDKTFLEKNKIKAIVNCTKEIAFLKNNTEKYRVSVFDNSEQSEIDDMTQQLPKAVAFIHKKYVVEKKNVLIHCVAGRMRSATVLVAFLYIYYNREKSIDEIIAFIVSKRPKVYHFGYKVNFSQSLKTFVNLDQNN